MTALRTRAILPGDLTARDPVNDEIWSESPRIQATVQEPGACWPDGDVGAQQAMCGSESLPWVPDLVGAEFHRPGSILVVGMAYSGFVRRAGQCRGVFPAGQYRSCGSASAFCTEFARSVVPVYSYYGNLLAALPPSVGPRCVAFTELCRVSLVRAGSRGDTSSGIERADRALFCRYADHARNLDWHQRRLVGSGARLVLALGHVAEHGLLRLLRDRLGCNVEAAGDSRVRFTRRSGPQAWCTAYAHDQRQIGTWGETRDWWRVSGAHGRWNVVTVPHTSEAAVHPVHVERIHHAWRELGENDA